MLFLFTNFVLFVSIIFSNTLEKTERREIGRKSPSDLGEETLATGTSSVRRILKRGGARNFRKFERNIDQNLKLSYSNFVPFFAQNQVKSKKKKGLPKSGEEQKIFFTQNQVISSPKPDA